jgi:hypothetical protein
MPRKLAKPVARPFAASSGASIIAVKDSSEIVNAISAVNAAPRSSTLCVGAGVAGGVGAGVSSGAAVVVVLAAAAVGAAVVTTVAGPSVVAATVGAAVTTVPFVELSASRNRA